MRSILRPITMALGLWGACVNAIDVQWDDESSVKEAAATIAYGLLKYYTGNYTGDVPGNLPDPYFWWHCGAMFGTLIDYWWLTGDDSYNDLVLQGMVHQVGKHKDYMPTNQTRTLGNDDQGFWAMAALTAAELKFEDPPEDEASWVALAQAVFNEYVTRWETAVCGGGLRWQIFTFNTGYDYKNSISNGCFFNVAARLARYTGNETYSEWAVKIWNWEKNMTLIGDSYEIFDGAHILEGDVCKRQDTNQWTYNAGIFLHGAAVMYNITEEDTWKDAVDGILANSKKQFFKNDIMYEPHCETVDNCDTDQETFKGFLSRWMAATAQLAPWTYDEIKEILDADAEQAVKVCTGPASDNFKGHDGTACGFTWLQDTFDDFTGVGPQMNALSAVMYTRIGLVDGPVTNTTGGTSKGDSDAGNEDSSKTQAESWKPITMGGKVGAGILTAMAVSGVVAGGVFIIT